MLHIFCYSSLIIGNNRIYIYTHIYIIKMENIHTLVVFVAVTSKQKQIGDLPIVEF